VPQGHVRDLADCVLLVATYWRMNLTMRQIGRTTARVSQAAAHRVIDTIGPLPALAPVRTRRIDSVAIVDGTPVLECGVARRGGTPIGAAPHELDAMLGGDGSDRGGVGGGVVDDHGMAPVQRAQATLERGDAVVDRDDDRDIRRVPQGRRH
jgi:hypothetical protein